MLLAELEVGRLNFSDLVEVKSNEDLNRNPKKIGIMKAPIFYCVTAAKKHWRLTLRVLDEDSVLNFPTRYYFGLFWLA